MKKLAKPALLGSHFFVSPPSSPGRWKLLQLWLQKTLVISEVPPKMTEQPEIETGCFSPVNLMLIQISSILEVMTQDNRIKDEFTNCNSIQTNLFFLPIFITLTKSVSKQRMQVPSQVCNLQILSFNLWLVSHYLDRIFRKSSSSLFRWNLICQLFLYMDRSFVLYLRKLSHT